MKGQSNIKADDLNGKYLGVNVLLNERQQQRERTLKWISDSALSKLRLAWRM